MLLQTYDWDLTHRLPFIHILPSHHMNMTRETSLEDAHTLMQN